MWTSSAFTSNSAGRSHAAAHRRRVRQLPLLAATIDLGFIDIDPLELIEDLDPGLATQMRGEEDRCRLRLASRTS